MLLLLYPRHTYEDLELFFSFFKTIFLEFINNCKIMKSERSNTKRNKIHSFTTYIGLPEVSESSSSLAYPTLGLSHSCAPPPGVGSPFPSLAPPTCFLMTPTC